MTSDQLSSICDHNTPLCVGGITSMGTPHIPSIPRTPIHTHMYHPLGWAWEAPICLQGQTPKLKHDVHGLELKAETDFLLRLFLRGSWKSDLNLSIFTSHHFWSQLLRWMILSWTFSCHHPPHPASALDSGQCCVLHRAGARGHQLLPAPLSSGALVASEGWLGTMPASHWSLVSQCSPLIGWWRLVSGPSEHGVRSQRALETLWHKNICTGEDH